MKRILKINSQQPSNVIFKFLMLFASMGFWIFGLIPFTSFYLIYELYLLLWCIGLCGTCYISIVNYNIISSADDGLNGLISSIMFVAHLFGHLVILMESWKMHRSHRQSLYKHFDNIQKTLKAKLQSPFKTKEAYGKLSTIILIFCGLIICNHGIIIWTLFDTNSTATLWYWRSLFSHLALHFKTLEILLYMVYANYCIDAMLNSVQKIGERNLERIFLHYHPLLVGNKRKLTFVNVVSLHQEQEDEEQVEILKSSYTKVYMLFQLLNRAYGWSLLASTAIYFMDFVCNAYWILLSIINRGKDYHVLLQSACFAMLSFFFLSLLCWLCEQVDFKSRYIGCMISKLVKPLGNKRYNDLVSEFSVQTLHQRFVVTAKEFFSLNLGLLGRMVTAIVTYLVILIQFMFTEESSKGSKFRLKSPGAAAAIFMANKSSNLE